MMYFFRFLSFVIIFAFCNISLLPGTCFSQTVIKTNNNLVNISFKADNAKDNDTVKSKNADAIKVSFNEKWKYLIGDSSWYSSIDFNEMGWSELPKGEEVELGNDSILKEFFGIVWFRTTIEVDSSVVGIPLGLFLRQKGSAAEIFLDGKFLERFGIVGLDKKSEEARFNVNPKPFPVVFSKSGKHQISVRFSSFHADNGKADDNDHGFTIEFSDLQNNLHTLLDRNVNFPIISLFAIYLTLGVVHIIMFSYFRADKHNLYFGLFCVGISFFLFSIYYSLTETNFEINYFLNETNIYTAPLLVVSLIALYHTIYYQRLLKVFWLLSALYVISVLSTIFDFELNNVALGIFIAISIYEVFRVHIRSIIKGRDGAWILGMGVLYFPLSIVLIMIYGIFINDSLDKDNKELGIIAAKTLGYSLSLSVPFSITLYLSRNFARINKKLILQVEEIKALSEKTLAQESEKKKILEEQNILLETKVQQRTSELAAKNELILVKNQEITDNLNYAKKIQAALLPDIADIESAFRECFVFYQPKDIVSGDFYAFFKKGNKKLLAAVDCTGHGVSGAFMSMIGSAALNQIINTGNKLNTAEILNRLNEEIITSLNQKSSSSNDGMDIAICCFELENSMLEYSGANRPLWMIRNKELMVFSPDKMPIGGLQFEKSASFTSHKIGLEHDDCLYIFSDGFADQFGGVSGKKLMTKKLKEILLQMNHLTMHEQMKHLTGFLNDWKGTQEQLDDILVIGIRI